MRTTRTSLITSLAQQRTPVLREGTHARTHRWGLGTGCPCEPTFTFKFSCFFGSTTQPSHSSSVANLEVRILRPSRSAMRISDGYLAAVITMGPRMGAASLRGGKWPQVGVCRTATKPTASRRRRPSAAGAGPPPAATQAGIRALAGVGAMPMLKLKSRPSHPSLPGPGPVPLAGD